MKKTKKLLAILLTSVMILSVFCVSISASNIDGVLIEDVTLREENVKHFKNPDGSYTALVYSSPVHRKDSAGNWQDIDNRMDSGTISDKQAYVTSDGRTVFSKKISSDDSSVYTLSENGYSIKMSISEDGLGNTSAKLSNHASKYIPKADHSLETQYKKVKEIDNTTTVTYKNALKGIDLKYQLSANDIKENIIVRKAQSAYSYTFVYELEGLEAELLDDGSVIFADEDTAEGIYRIPTPYMTDAEGARSDAVAYTLSETAEGVYSLTVTADASWINSEDRELPVTIDPTVTMNDENVYITYIDETNDMSNYSGSGKVSSDKITMLKIYNMPTLADNATITDATLSFNCSTSATSGTTTMGIYRVYGFWTDYDVTWYDVFYNSNTDISLSSSSYNQFNFNASSYSSRAYSVDITNMIWEWYDNTEDYGIAIKYISGAENTYNVSCSTSALSITYSLQNLTINNGLYVIKNVYANDYLQLDDENTVQNTYELYDYNLDNTIIWNVEYLHNGYYKFENTEDNNRLSSYVTSDGDYWLRHMSDFDNTNMQDWQVTHISSNQYRLSPKNGYNKFLSNTLSLESLDSSTEESSFSWYLYKIDLLSVNLEVLFDGAYAIRNRYPQNSIRSDLNRLVDKFLSTFGVYINIPSITQFTSYADQCVANTDLPCTHGFCENSTQNDDGIFNNIADYHHTNVFNILARFSLPNTSQTLRLAYIGRSLCYSDGLCSNLDGQTGPFGVCFDEEGVIFISKNANEKTIVHEFGHLYGAPDHDTYSRLQNVQNYHPNYSFSMDCIYGANKNLAEINDNLVICDGCRSIISCNINKYNHNLVLQ